MLSMKRVRLAVLFVIAAALLAATSAFAGHGYGQKSTYSVKLAPTGVEPAASGVAKVTLSVYLPVSSAHGTVTCKGLTPNANYVVLIKGLGFNGIEYVGRTYGFYLTTDGQGAGGITYSVQCWSLGPMFGAYGGPSGQLVLAQPGFTYP